MSRLDHDVWRSTIVNSRRYASVYHSLCRGKTLVSFDNHGPLTAFSDDPIIAGPHEQTLCHVLDLARLLPVALVSGDTTANLHRVVHSPVNPRPWIEPRAQLAERIELVGLHGGQRRHGGETRTHPDAERYRARMADAYGRIKERFDDLDLADGLATLEDKDGLGVSLRYRPIAHADRVSTTWASTFRASKAWASTFDHGNEDGVSEYPVAHAYPVSKSMALTFEYGNEDGVWESPSWEDHLLRAIWFARDKLGPMVRTMRIIADELHLKCMTGPSSCEVACPGFDKSRAVEDLFWRTRERIPGVDSIAYFGDGPVELKARRALVNLFDSHGVKFIFCVVVTPDTNVDVLNAADVVCRSRFEVDSLLGHWLTSLLEIERHPTLYQGWVGNPLMEQATAPVDPPPTSPAEGRSVVRVHDTGRTLGSSARDPYYAEALSDNGNLWWPEVINPRRYHALEGAVRNRRALLIFDDHVPGSPLAAAPRRTGPPEPTLRHVLHLARLLPVSILSGETTDHLHEVVHAATGPWPSIEFWSQSAGHIELVGLHGAQRLHGDERHTHHDAEPYRERMRDAYLRVSKRLDDLGLNRNFVALEDRDGLAVRLRYRPLADAAGWKDRFVSGLIGNPGTVPGDPEFLDQWSRDVSIHEPGLAQMLMFMEKLSGELQLAWSRKATSAEISCPGFDKGRAIKELFWRACAADHRINTVAYFGDGTVDLPARDGLLELRNWGCTVFYWVILPPEPKVYVNHVVDMVCPSPHALDGLLEHWVSALLHNEHRRTTNRGRTQSDSARTAHRSGRAGTPSAGPAPDVGLTR